MKRFRLLIPVLVLLVFVSAGQGTTSAHELKEDNGISAVLHIPPDDNPKSGQDTLFYFAFSSQQPGFDLGYCKCQVSFQASDNRLNTAPLTQDVSDPLSASASLTFDKPGAYNVIVRGQTGTSADSTFSLNYLVRVVAGTSAAQTAARQTASWQVILLGVTGLVIVGVIASEMIRRGSRYTKDHAAER